MNDEQAASMLEDLLKIYHDPVQRNQHRKDVLRYIIDLSHIHYLPAQSFFFEGLDDPDWTWRLHHLRALGYHYKIEPDGPIATKIRSMLIDDLSAEVRMSAASILAGFAEWPDWTLMNALSLDQDADVRSSAFEALLMLMGSQGQSLRE
jgi:hypothetical protein